MRTVTKITVNVSTPSSSSAKTLNAAFLQEIKEDNQRLRDLLRDATQILSLPRPAPALVLVQTLHALCDQLAMHFALENAYGYLDDALEIAPRLSRRARALRGEHEQLFADFCAIIGKAEGLLDDDQPHHKLTHVAVLFFDFQARFQAHEACENELIFEAFDDDLGVGD